MKPFQTRTFEITFCNPFVEIPVTNETFVAKHKF